MKLSAAILPALFRAAGPVCLFLAACDPVDDPNAKGKPWRPAPEQPRRATNVDHSNAEWLAAWRDLRTRLAPLETRLAELQKLHAESHFDNFLTLSVDSLSVEQLSSLYHFLDRGYFTVERRVLIHLLERRLDRTGSPLAIPAGEVRSLKENLATAMHRDEIRMVDLETAIRFYEETGNADFQVPTQLSAEEIEELRETVDGMLDKAAAEIADLDRKIAALKKDAFPELPLAPPPAPPELLSPPGLAPEENGPSPAVTPQIETVPESGAPAEPAMEEVPAAPPENIPDNTPESAEPGEVSPE